METVQIATEVELKDMFEDLWIDKDRRITLEGKSRDSTGTPQQ
jgi:hypothetical protein